MSEDSPFFSVIVPDYEGAVPRARLRRAVRSLADQSFQDFEVILIHDGPKSTSYDTDLAGMRCPPRMRLRIAAQRHDDFGHSLRDLGMREATGRYIVHLNADNLLYERALERIHEHLCASLPPIRNERGLVNADHIAVFAVLMRGMTCVGQKLIRYKGKEDTFSLILTGVPPRPNGIDAMQLVMKRELWLAEGGWTDRSQCSDGVLYTRFVEKYGARYIPEVLGEHW